MENYSFSRNLKESIQENVINYRTAFYCGLLALTAGCATIFREPGAQDVTLNSNPQGAVVELMDTVVGKTPLILNLGKARGGHITLYLKTEGYKPYEVNLKKKSRKEVFGNLIFGPFAPIGMFVDGISKSNCRVEPKEVYIDFLKDGKTELEAELESNPDLVTQQLRRLKKLRELDIITEKEYNRLRGICVKEL